jgi:hypothetical protein
MPAHAVPLAPAPRPQDHTDGIADHARHIYCTPLTLELARIKFPALAARLDSGAAAATLLREPPGGGDVGDTLHIGGGGGGGGFSVTPLFLADHCPGAALLGVGRAPALLRGRGCVAPAWPTARSGGPRARPHGGRRVPGARAVRGHGEPHGQRAPHQAAMRGSARRPRREAACMHPPHPATPAPHTARPNRQTPGAAMLLFESEAWGSILHTGDCRVTEQLPRLRAALDELLGEGAPLGLLHLDATAGDTSADMTVRPGVG